MTKQPSVSIVMPVYNVEAYVADCIKSVMRQSYCGEMECIVVDDCGADNSMETVEKLVSEYDGPVRFKLLHHEYNRGLSAARNTGMESASGDYLLFLDSDDVVTEDCLEVLTRPLTDRQYDVVIGGFEWSIFSLSSSRNTFSEDLSLTIPNNTLLEQPDILHTFQKGWNPFAWNKLIRSDFVKENNLFFKEGMIQEDLLWSFQVACMAKTLFFISDVTYRYKLREGSICDTLPREGSIRAYETVIQEARSFVDTHGIHHEDVFPFFNVYFWMILEHYSNSKDLFVSEYKKYRPYCIKPPFSLVKERCGRFANLVRWAHYWMPDFFAPYWQWALFRFRFSFSGSDARNDHFNTDSEN